MKFTDRLGQDWELAEGVASISVGKSGSLPEERFFCFRKVERAVNPEYVFGKRSAEILELLHQYINTRPGLASDLPLILEMHGNYIMSRVREELKR